MGIMEGNTFDLQKGVKKSVEKFSLVVIEE
jgi:hypothetical protein